MMAGPIADRILPPDCKCMCSHLALCAWEGGGWLSEGAPAQLQGGRCRCGRLYAVDILMGALA